MSNAFPLELVDVDGAIRESEDAVAGDTRAGLFRKAAIGGGTLVAGGLLIGGLPELALGAPSPRQNVKVLNFALTLEYLEAEFYDQAIKAGALTGDVLSATQVVAEHENEHVEFLQKALGRAAVKKPKFDFQGTTTDPAKFLPTAQALEDTGVAAYSGQATNLFGASVIKAAVSILTVEARHASRFRTLNNESFAPRSFDRPRSRKQVLKIVAETNFIQD